MNTIIFIDNNAYIACVLVILSNQSSKKKAPMFLSFQYSNSWIRKIKEKKYIYGIHCHEPKAIANTKTTNSTTKLINHYLLKALLTAIVRVWDFCFIVLLAVRAH